ncbi:hypothetical protein BC940DRAFT_328809 [Gongronella butleri]|nr:hypothetical protein BC940DRAFT_328809 [Gongronella butleri]
MWTDGCRLSQARFKVWYNQDLIHTPLAPYNIKKLKAAAGVMITATHNTKDDK